MIQTKQPFIMLRTTLAVLLIATIAPSKVSGQTATGVALETIGALSSITVYNYYTIIGALSDGYEAGIYDDTVTIELIREQQSSIEDISDQMQALLESGFITDSEDRQYILDMQICLGSLFNQADWLLDYIETGSEDDAEYFQDARSESWDCIVDFLGLE